MNNNETTFMQFKGQVIDAVISHSMRLIKPFIGMYLIYSVLSLIVLFPILMFMLPAEIFDMAKEILLKQAQPDLDYFSNLDPSMFTNNIPQLLIGGFVLVIVALVMSAWYYNWALTMSRQIIENGESSLYETLQSSFNRNVGRLIGLSAAILGIYFLALVVIALFAAIIKAFAVLFIFPLLFGMIRLSISYPAVSSGEMSIAEALRFSWKNISWGRSAKIFLGAIVFAVVLLLFGLLGTLITSIAGTGVIGMLLQIIVQIVTGTFTLAFTIAALNGLFYRYAQFDYVAEDSETDHLIS